MVRTLQARSNFGSASFLISSSVLLTSASPWSGDSRGDETHFTFTAHRAGGTHLALSFNKRCPLESCRSWLPPCPAKSMTAFPVAHHEMSLVLRFNKTCFKSILYQYMTWFQLGPFPHHTEAVGAFGLCVAQIL